MTTRSSMAPGSGIRRKVLVCDDEPHTARLIQVCLERHGCRVVKASNGIEGLIRVRNQQFDLVVLDVMMPGLTGLEVLKEIRADAELEHLPVVMVTARATDRDVIEGYNYGADVYLTKPFNPIELLRLLK